MDSTMKLKKNSSLLMIGDSITDAGRDRNPESGSLGDGYVAQVQMLLSVAYHDFRIRVINRGISGNTVRDLKERWQNDVLDIKPDWLSVMIGINDVWRQFDTPQAPESHVYIDEYESTLNALIDKATTPVKGLVIMTPFFIEPNRSQPMRAMMDKYGRVAKRAAKRRGAILVDTQAAFDRVLKTHSPSELSWDQIHPKPDGAFVIARAFLRAIEFNFDRRR
jgi:lysophospholipase L1-like esterase